MALIYISVGSNIERHKNILRAFDLLQQRYGTIQASTVYENSAVGFDGDDFYNLVLCFHTEEDPQTLVGNLHQIEEACGRIRPSTCDSRTMDLDLLIYDDLVLQQGKLQLPRPEITEYPFVLKPLAEIAGDRPHPISGQTYTELWQTFPQHNTSLTPVPFTLGHND
ncbi:MAG: 2-amino-4-hydroxy-6-hydroxymethyldihydropteridine diphosphokinase [Gammaproteobacteria bacterium]|nr:2-amino-4-hydroxy-6-hydroxymethyldihydropteridine diphosphokinase [Gammaproteobacteria bacterium]